MKGVGKGWRGFIGVGRGSLRAEVIGFEGSLWCRTFDFEYEFWPRSEEEAIMVNHIIYTFRTCMLPDTFGEKIGQMAVNDDHPCFVLLLFQ